MIAYHPTKSSWQKVSSSEVVVVRVTVWLYKSSLWPWPWRQQTFFSAWHSGSFCCITIPNLVTKYFMVQKISSWQTFTDIFNLCCDLDLEHSNPIFPQDTLVYNAVLSDQVWLQTDQQFGRYSRNSPIHCDLDIEDSEPSFLPDTLPHDNTQPYQVCLKMVGWFRQYCLDKIRLMDRMTDGQMYRETKWF